MRFLVIVLLFCFAVAGSALLAKVGWRGSVEGELARRSRAVLDEAGFDGVLVEFDHLQARLSGAVDRPDQVGEVLRALEDGVPGASWPEPGAADIGIRPTLPPRLRVAREEGAEGARIEGTLAAAGDAGRSLLGSRLRSVAGLGRIDNEIALDPMVKPFSGMAPFVSLAVELLGLPGASELELAEGRLVVSGSVPNEGIRSALLDLAAATGAEEIVAEGLRVVAPTAFTRFAEVRITRNRFGVSLSGTLPDGAAAAAVREAFAAAGAPLAGGDRLEVAADCGPSPWQEGFAQSLAALFAELRGEFTAEFSSGQIRISGTTADPDSRRRLLERFAPLQAGEGAPEIIADLAVMNGSGPGSAVAFSVAYEGGLLALSGTLPDAGLAEAIEEKVREALPETRVKSEIEPTTGGLGDAWAKGLPDFLADALPRVSAAKFVFGEGALEIDGRTLAPGDRQILQNLAVNTVPASYRVINRLLHADQSFPKPSLLPEDRTRLAEFLKSMPVPFEKGADALSAEGRTRVAAIAEKVKEAGGEVALVVTGFADNVGNPESNRRLGLRRAESVKSELVGLGVPDGVLSLESKIEDVSRLPRAEHGRARRAEVTVAPAEAR